MNNDKIRCRAHISMYANFRKQQSLLNGSYLRRFHSNGLIHWSRKCGVVSNKRSVILTVPNIIYYIITL